MSPRAALRQSLLTGPLLATLACGYARMPAFTGPEKGGPPWVELRSPHFVVRSDLPIEEARRLVHDYERIYAALEDLVFADVNVPAIRTSVLALRRRTEFGSLGLGHVSSVYIRRFYNDDDRLPALIIEGYKTGRSAQLLLQHELTHRFLYHYLPNAPAWFSEGYAIYVSTLSFERKGVKVGNALPGLYFRNEHSWDSGGPRWGSVSYASVDELPTVAELLASGPGDFRLQTHDPMFREADARRVFANTAGAWSLVHLLWHNRDEYEIAVQKYMFVLARGDTPEQAWALAFGGMSLPRMEADYQAFVRGRGTGYSVYPDYKPRAAEIDIEGILPPAHVHLLWATIMPWRSQKVIERARLEIATASAIAPDDPEVLLWRARLARRDGRLDLADAALRHALKASPDDERYLLERFEIRLELAERLPAGKRDYAPVEALLPELQRHASAASTLHALALYLEQRGRIDEAVPMAEGAVASDFACFPCLDTLASLHARKGQHERAYRTQLRALNVLPDGARDDDVLAHLEVYRKAFLSAQPAPPEPPAIAIPEPP